MSMKAKILELLREKETYVSGQELCEQFGVSRTAVWKAIGQLKKEGYVIEAVQNKGYHLVDQAEEVYNQADIQSRLKTKWVGHPLLFFDSIDSTNIRAKLEAEQGAESGLLVVADQQTAGRGRRGRGWESPSGSNIYYTLMLKPDFNADCAPMLTLVMALAVAKGIRQTLGRGSEEGAAKVGIKWPNDLVLNRKKLCGILTELEWEAESGEFSCVIIGAGINVSQDEADFGPEVAPIAISLAQALGTAPDRTELAAQVIRSLNALYDDFPSQNAAYLDHFRRDCLTVGNPIKVISGAGERIGTATGISDDFGLTVRWEDGSMETLTSGEVSVRGLYDYV